MKKFQDAFLLSCEIHQIPGYGPRFTWSNKKHGEAFTKEKLDMALANDKGMELLPGSKYHTLPTLKFNHSPLLIYWEGHSPIVKKKKSNVFRYKATWDLSPQYSSIFKDFWLVNHDAKH